MTMTAKDKRIASRLECLPSELIEPILANLTFRDIIALSICAEDNCQLANAPVISPAWKDIWPVYVARRSEFQTIMSLIVPLGGGSWHDPTDGELDLTPDMFRRRMVRGKELYCHSLPGTFTGRNSGDSTLAYQ
ncbi:uncharacterized protein QC763_711660 [Podospora pseudopauciseta]|uniref:F-box domain-containing protein n=2 Tax=Podospora TaxID=5144 RepID=A0ABR0H2U4_9PEZI|nr:hypothetical protein QC763_711660 [Podospora pseudopauciseta]KAK4668911.1 hypothetical protein QC764_711660 [Podospora pseudoanserina]